MKVKLITTVAASKENEGGCGDGSCPSVYESDRNTFLIQGFKLVPDDRQELIMPSNEDVVEVPKALIEQFLKTIGK